MAPVGVVIIDGTAASFCYPVWRTETLWDISIDTLEEHRGRALGSHAVRFMIELLRRDGREPVWGALESNGASLRLAAKLGFQPVDALVWFSRGPWAFLTAGFQGEP
jgi:GNAT superfamily N-acetyltransferase